MARRNYWRDIIAALPRYPSDVLDPVTCEKCGHTRQVRTPLNFDGTINAARRFDPGCPCSAASIAVTSPDPCGRAL